LRNPGFLLDELIARVLFLKVATAMARANPFIAFSAERGKNSSRTAAAMGSQRTVLRIGITPPPTGRPSRPERT
jgi:hypothetical protein